MEISHLVLSATPQRHRCGARACRAARYGCNIREIDDTTKTPVCADSTPVSTRDFAYQKSMKRSSDRPSIDELARRLAESLPAGLRSMRDELEQNFRAVLRSTLDRLDLVTREEFEVQRLVLERTREKLEALGERLERLESTTPGQAPAKKKAAGRKTANDDAGSGTKRGDTGA